jgi:hypothetical protein
VISDSSCPQCYGNSANPGVGTAAIKYCHKHGADPDTTICTCYPLIDIYGMCKACVGTNSAAIAMFRKIQGKW